jgi:hypothetical protein
MSERRRLRNLGSGVEAAAAAAASAAAAAAPALYPLFSGRVYAGNDDEAA